MLSPAERDEMAQLIDERVGRLVEQRINQRVEELVGQRLALYRAPENPFERLYSQRQLSRMLGLSRYFLRKSFLRELGLALPPRGHCRSLIRHSDVERLIQKLGLQVNWVQPRRAALRKAG